jgi:peptide deformylase
MIKPIVGAKAEVLRKKAKSVKVFDKKLEALARDLVDTLSSQNEPDGVGLAGPQIDKSQAIFAALIDKTIRIFVNPIITKTENPPLTATEKKKADILEGCLSLINYYGPVERNKAVTLQYQDIQGQKHTEVFRGLSAQIIEHEVDHLNGVLFVDRILEQKKPLYKIDPKTDQWEEVEL